MLKLSAAEFETDCKLDNSRLKTNLRVAHGAIAGREFGDDIVMPQSLGGNRRAEGNLYRSRPSGGDESRIQSVGRAANRNRPVGHPFISPWTSFVASSSASD